MPDNSAPSLRRPIRASLILYFTKLGGIAVSTITLGLTARYLNEGIFGDFSAVLAYSGVVVSLLDFGVGWIAAREVSIGNRTPLVALRTWKYLVSVIGLIASLLILPLLGFNQDIQQGVLAIGMFTFFTAINSFQIGLLQGISQLERTALSDTVGKFVNLALTYLVVRLDGGYLLLLSVQNVVGFVIVCINGIQLRREKVIIKGVHLKGLRVLAPDLLIMPLVTAASYLIYRVDMLILARLAMREDVAIYSAAYRIIDVAASIPAILIATLLPLITRAIHENKDQAKELCRNSYKISAFLGSSLTLLLVVSAPFLISLVVGEKYVALANHSIFGISFNSVRVLQVLACYVVLSFLGSLLSGILLAARQQNKMIIVTVIGLVVNVIGNLLLVPHISYIGSAILTVSTELVLIICMIVALWKSGYLVGMVKAYVPAVGCTLISIGCYGYLLAGIQLGNILSAALSLLVYVGLMVLIADPSDRSKILVTLQRKLYG